MNNPIAAAAQTPSWLHRVPFYYGWVNVIVASLAMTATLPGRTHGLGLVTEPLVADLKLNHVDFARINLIASLAGAAFCVPAGWLIDRWGVRSVLAGIAAALGGTVIGMSGANSGGELLAWLILVRGLGQSALSVASMAVIGKWFRRRLGPAMGVFAVALTIGFIASVLGVGGAVSAWGWRDAWRDMGFVVLALAPVFWLTGRSTPESCGLTPDEPAADSAGHQTRGADLTLRQAAATPAFWCILLGGSAFNFVWSAVTLFNESMLKERGLAPSLAVEVMAILTGAGLIANLACGALATRARVARLLGVGLALLAVALIGFPTIQGVVGARLYAAAIGLCGGIITVVFFSAWGLFFGRSHLGRIQGAAQLATVLASALGPVAAAEGRAAWGSYTPVFYGLAALAAALAVAAWRCPLPPPINDGERDGLVAAP